MLVKGIGINFHIFSMNVEGLEISGFSGFLGFLFVHVLGVTGINHSIRHFPRP